MLKPDYVLLQKALKGQKLSVIKEIGFYTYLLIYNPVRQPDEGRVVGVTLTARLIDVQYQIKNRFFQQVGLTGEIKDKIGIDISIIPSNTITGYLFVDSTRLSENSDLDIYGLQNSLIGKILIPRYDKTQHSKNLVELTDRIISVLIFFTSVLMIILFIRVLKFTDSGMVKLALFGGFLILIRYLWLQFEFPANTFHSEIFSPDYYASKFGFGIVKSIGELLVTSVIFLIYSIYAATMAYKKFKELSFNSEQSKENIYLFAFKGLLLLASFFLSFKIFGAIIQSIIYDSNLKFLDSSRIIPSMELFSLQVVLLIISFSFYTLITTIFLYLIIRTKDYFNNDILKNFGSIGYMILFLAVNEILEALSIDFGVSYWYRVLIIILIFAFAFYIGYLASRDREYTFFSIKNFSIIVLICIITIPIITLDNITSQETKFVELIGEKLSEHQEDRVNFVLNTELVTLSENKEIEENIRDKNKLPRLAFYLWADSKLNSENFNSSIIILDTNKRVVSDFSINETKLSSDSILQFLKTDFFEKGYDINLEGAYTKVDEPLLEEDTTLLSEGDFEDEEKTYGDNEDLPFISNELTILNNPEGKFYTGIAPIQKLDLKNTQFARLLGYIVIGISYESRNFLLQSSLEIFKNYTKDNLLDKIISKPVFTEYINGRVASTTNKDLAISGLNSLEIFKEYIKNSEKKSEWRIENFGNEKYRSYYIMSEPGETEEGIYERIYSISLKRDDFRITAFYYLKFIIFAVFVYLVLYALFALYYIYRHRKFRLNFREKLFLSFFLVSVIPIILLAIYTRGFIITKNDANLQNQIISDLNILSESLKGKQLVNEDVSDPDSLGIIQRDFLKGSISRTDKNFNLYVKNKLISTTNEELYKSDLLDTRADAEANYNINYLNKDLFLKTQSQGSFSYLVAYKPYKDPKNNIVGMLSSQLVYRQNEINEELTETLTFIFGIYFIVIILSLIIVSILTEKISKPILELKRATDKLSKGQSNVQLRVSSKDELQGLVESFNNMTKELERSKRELKKAEREAAWRDIARRVAHEIKNPLTPMKLSIQHLVNIYKENGKAEFPDVLEKTNKLISNEIDKLNRIATEFSNFAKLPKRNYEALNLNATMREVISLYANHPNIEFKTELDDSIMPVLADREEMNRVFQNLIKNSVQAIEENGMVEVISYQKKNHVFFEITDTGIGMEKEVIENLFEPNFSTKSSGMGLGLAISKKSLDDMKAKINYASEPGEGTKVTLRFNIIKN